MERPYGDDLSVSTTTSATCCGPRATWPGRWPNCKRTEAAERSTQRPRPKCATMLACHGPPFGPTRSPSHACEWPA
jgi:hypothetical protein